MSDVQKPRELDELVKLLNVALSAAADFGPEYDVLHYMISLALIEADTLKTKEAARARRGAPPV